MVITCIVAGFCLAVCGIVIAYITRKDMSPKTNTPPPLPPRATVNTPSPSVSQTQFRSRNSETVPVLPPRRIGPRTVSTSNLGPRGVRPDQFPCCPFDKQRNVVGEPQLIFWDQNSNCYRCSRGHQFKSNGKLL